MAHGKKKKTIYDRPLLTFDGPFRESLEIYNAVAAAGGIRNPLMFVSLPSYRSNDDTAPKIY